MKKISKDQLQKMIDDVTSEKDLSKFDHYIKSSIGLEPSADFSHNVLSKLVLKPSTKAKFEPRHALILAASFLLVAFITYLSITTSFSTYEQSINVLKYSQKIRIDFGPIMKVAVFANVILLLLVIDKLFLSRLFNKA